MNPFKKAAEAVATAFARADLTELEQRRDNALQARDAARSEHGRAILDGDPIEVGRTRKALAIAEDAFLSADLAADALEARKTQQAAANDAKAAQAKADAVNAALVDAQAVPKLFEEGVAKLGAAFAAFLAINDRLAKLGASDALRNDVNNAGIWFVPCLAYQLREYPFMKQAQFMSESTGIWGNHLPKPSAALGIDK